LFTALHFLFYLDWLSAVITIENLPHTDLLAELGNVFQAVAEDLEPMTQGTKGQLIRPAAKNQGIEKRIGWHTFRRTYATLLRSVGTEFKVMQELMRHSSLRSTLDIYAQAITPAKHAAQAAVVSLMFPPGSSSAAVADSAELRPQSVDIREVSGRRTQMGRKTAPFLHPSVSLEYA
jgi:hypothetical protein